MKYVTPYDLGVLAMALLWAALMTTMNPPARDDDWYHLSVIRAFTERGFTTNAWWQYQPAGRPHLYPPLLHLTAASLIRQTPLSIGGFNRLYKILTYPAGMLMMWLGVRLLLGPSVAFWFVLLLASELTLYDPGGIMILPSSWVLYSIPLLFWCVLRGHSGCAAGLLTAGLYTHLGIPLVIALTLAIMAWRIQDARKPIAKTAAMSIMLFSPWLIFFLIHHHAIHPVNTPLGFQMPVLLWLFGGIGAVMVWRRGVVEERVWLYFAVALLLLLPRYAHRFWPYIAIPLSVLGSLWLVNQKPCAGRVLGTLVLVSCILGQLYVLAPRSIISIYHSQSSGLRFYPAPFAKLVMSLGKGDDPFKGDVRSSWIQKNTKPDDIIIIEHIREGDRIFTLTGRRTTTGGWVEVGTPEMWDTVRRFIDSGAGIRVPSLK